MMNLVSDSSLVTLIEANEISEKEENGHECERECT